MSAEFPGIPGIQQSSIIHAALKKKNQKPITQRTDLSQENLDTKAQTATLIVVITTVTNRNTFPFSPPINFLILRQTQQQNFGTLDHVRQSTNSKHHPMSKERFTERQADVRESASRLTEAVAQPESELIRDATIQRFEFTFEVVWKTLKLYLERQGHECGGPRPTLKKAFAENLIPTPEEADHWLQMLEDRNLTSHAYDEALASQIYQHIVRDYAPLLGGMADKIQTLQWD